jgi:hypothetical protein
MPTRRAKLDIRHAAIGLQFGEDLAVNGIELGVGHHGPAPSAGWCSGHSVRKRDLAQFYFANRATYGIAAGICKAHPDGKCPR